MHSGNQNGPVSPLREATFYILLSLAQWPRHGYAIMKEVEASSHGRVTLSTSTLYGAIKRLLQDGWIERLEDARQVNGRERKAYRLTDHGHQVLAGEIERLESLLQAARRPTAEESR